MPPAAATGAGRSGVRFGWLARLIGSGLALYLRLVAATSRLSGDVTRDQVVLAAWHEYNLVVLAVALKVRRDLPHASFSTRGFRGTVITTILERFDVRVLPLPDESSRAESRDLALRLARLAGAGTSLVVTPDGPFGPYRVAKPGALIVARESGLAIQPWAISARPGFRLRGRWDRHLVPLPFGRLRVFGGERVALPERGRLRPSVAALQVALDEVAARADA
jgi:lysophospholipid acyltransferase (LPLAT)-like uncharacterized protein